jgi:nucleoside-diphosphate-sugar epimerase
MKSILVTGGAGYVGSMLVRELLKEHFRVVCVDNLRFGGESLLDVWGDPNFEFHNFDITNHGDIDGIMGSNDLFAVVHLAAIVGDPACRLEPELARRTNWDASAYLLEKSIKSGVSRFVFASTCSNYGKMEDSSGYVDEQSPLTPVSLYARLKVDFENLLLKKVQETSAFCPTALRFATVYGISPRMRFDLTVNEFTKEVAMGRELVVFGEQFWRPYCHVGDFSRAILAVLNAPAEKVAYNVFNVGSTQENYTKKMIVDELLRRYPEARIKFVEKDEDPRDYRVSFAKIEQEIGFRISKTVPQGIEEISQIIKLGIIRDPDAQKHYNTPRDTNKM